ncbi:MAG: InlB B-repeat-containing protein [Lachnospiraceae bacterium]|nr:InlB B-repeat-containing protein [Lachnospiraceae bacterium]
MEGRLKNIHIINLFKKLPAQAILILSLAAFIMLNPITIQAADPSNAPTKGSIVAGYLSDPELQTVSANSVYKAPEGEIKATFTSVADMRMNATDLENGDYIQTLNYYEGVAGGGAVYQVEKSQYNTDNGGTIIDLSGDIRCKLVSGNNTVSPMQFGAYGDGVTDDHAALEATFKSGFGTIILEGRTYISNDTIWIATSDITIEGMGATITCDNNFGSYQEEGKANHTMMYITNCSNITLKHFRLLDGQTTTHTRGGLSFQSVTNAHMSWCSLVIPQWDAETAGRCASTLSFQNGWHNVSVTHCEIINMAGVYEGGAIGFNDMYASGSDNALFENNVVIYNVKDEVIAIFSHSRGGSDYFGRDSYIRNVLIRHNEFYGPKSDTYKRDLDFSVGYDDSLEVDNVVYEENYFETDAVWAFMTFSKTATNCAARGNVINICQTSNQNSMTVFKSSGTNQAVVEDNIITISTENDNMPASVAMGNILFQNNQVTANCDMIYLFEYGVVSDKNKILVNGTLKKALSYQGGNMTDTNITITGKCGAMYESYNMVMKKDILWKGNNIQIPNATATGCVLNFNGITMNGYRFIMQDNVIATPSAEKNSMLIYDSLQDANPSEQQVIMTGNQLGAFYCKGNKVSVYRTNNVINSYDNTTIKDYEVVFDLDGKGEADSQSVVEGETAKEPEVKNLTGYKLLGWYTDKTYETPWDFAANIINENTTIYAKLEKLPDKDTPSNSANDNGQESDLPELSSEQIENSENADTVANTKTLKKPAKVTNVKLKKVKVTSKTSKKRKVKITWKSVKDATGYQIYVSTNKGKKYKKVKTISAKKKCTYTYTSQKGKTVYVKIRAYKKKDGMIKYGNFSKAKKLALK